MILFILQIIRFWLRGTLGSRWQPAVLPQGRCVAGHGAARSWAQASAACPQLCPTPSRDGRDLARCCMGPGQPRGPQQPQCNSRGAVGLAVPSTGCRCPCAPHTAGIVQGWHRPCLALGWGCWAVLCRGTARGQCGDCRHTPCCAFPTPAGCPAAQRAPHQGQLLKELWGLAGPGEPGTRPGATAPTPLPVQAVCWGGSPTAPKLLGESSPPG